ncbi:class I lanthipeptide [Dinghuibacter silviterrae]|uniref:Uncharacterized protein n=1 Tax=Dinghuibacter silviterrae TaxID=1539049 RepID=A0A4R8DJY5_9BACT|nr:class I lanthipeptide [Dinghuibacter silviterrae]TDW97496.1 hypothetical protein EDB95_5346 [Dinghuibacter silviterrae]
MKKIELSQPKLQLKREKIAQLNNATAAASQVEPTTTVLLSIQHKCPFPR